MIIVCWPPCHFLDSGLDVLFTFFFSFINLHLYLYHDWLTVDSIVAVSFSVTWPSRLTKRSNSKLCLFLVHFWQFRLDACHACLRFLCVSIFVVQSHCGFEEVNIDEAMSCVCPSVCVSVYLSVASRVSETSEAIAIKFVTVTTTPVMRMHHASNLFSILASHRS